MEFQKLEEDPQLSSNPPPVQQIPAPQIQQTIQLTPSQLQQLVGVQQPQQVIDPKRLEKQKKNLIISVLSSLIALAGTACIWASGFIDPDSTSFITIWLIFYECFVGVSCVTIVVSSNKDRTNFALTITGVVFSAITMLASFITAAICASEADHACNYGWYTHEKCTSFTLATAGGFLVFFSLIGVLVIGSLEIRRVPYTPKQQTQVIVVAAPGNMPGNVQYSNVPQPQYYVVSSAPPVSQPATVVANKF